jgi:hypothetical protein
MAMSKLVKDRKTNLYLGGALFVAGAYMLYCAFDGGDRRAPWFIRPFLPF